MKTYESVLLVARAIASVRFEEARIAEPYVGLQRTWLPRRLISRLEGKDKDCGEEEAENK